MGVREGLEPFLPKPHVVKNGDKFDIEQPERTDSYTVENNHVGPFLGNFLVIVRALSYILSLGKENIKMVGPLSVLNANYIKESLKDDYELRYTDYASTNSFSMASRTSRPALLPWMWPSVCSIMAIMLQLFTFRCFSMKPMMIEPTENESKETLDGFIEVMHNIAKEARENPEIVKGAPHTTPISRVDDVEAAKHPVLTFRQLAAE